MAEELDDLQRITSNSEVERISSALASKAIPLAGYTADQQQFQFNVQSVENGQVQVTASAPVIRGLRSGEAIEICFGLNDGYYLLKTKITQAAFDEASFLLGDEIYRVQRRANFRTPVPSDFDVVFKLTSLRQVTQARDQKLKLLDMSASGVKLIWPWQGSVKPSEGDHISGLLILPGGRQLELFGLIRSVMIPDAGTFHVGVEFQNLGLRDEQVLLHTCVLIQQLRQSERQRS